MLGRRFSASALLVVMLAACGGGDDGAAATAAARLTGGMEAQRAGVERFSKDAATAAATQQPAGIGAIAKIGAGVMGPDQVRQIAQTAIAQAMNVPPDQVAVDRVEQVDWRDASIGCAQAGMMYAQVITPGFRVVTIVAGQRKEVHTDMTGRTVVCDSPTQ
jgi:hypothetical protein